ncbi:F0F1 ATP synthase subunit gamma [Aquifex sp.]
MKAYSDKLKAYASLKELFGVLSVVSLNRLRRAKQEVYPQTPYYRRLEEVLEHLFYLYPHHPLFKPRKETKTVVLLFGSDLSYTRSLCNKLFKVLERLNYAELVVAGEKCVNRKLFEKFPTVRLGEVFGKTLNFPNVLKTINKLFEEYKKDKLSRIYILYAKPHIPKADRKPYGETKEHEPFHIPRQILYERKTPKAVKATTLGESFTYEVVLLPFLPPPLKGRYKKGEILNIEVSEEELIPQILKLYLSFYIKFLMLEHYTVLNLVRFQNTKRMEDNVEQKIKELKRLISKLRQEKITRELEDIIFALLAFEDKVFKDFRNRFAVLEIGKEIERKLKERIVNTVRKHFPVKEIRELSGMLGFRIITPSEVYDFTLEYYLEDIKKRITLAVDLS